MKHFYSLLTLTLLCVVANATKYTLVTNIDQLTSGDKVIVACNSVGCVAGPLTGTNMPKVTDGVTFASDKSYVITNNAYEYTIYGGGTGWVLSNSDGSIGCTSNKNALTTDATANKYSSNWELTIDSNGDITYLCKSNSYKNTYLYYNNSAGFFANYDTKQKAVQFYRLSADDTTPSIDCVEVVDFGVVKIQDGNGSAEKQLTVEARNLTEKISANITAGGDNFSVSPAQLDAAGGNLTISFTAVKAGEYTATLRLQSGSASADVTLTASAKETSNGGTKDQPYTCGDVISMALDDADSKAWVEGYILGSAATGPVVASSANGTSLLLADDMSGTNPIAVQLPSGNIRSELNIVDNPSNIGRRVKVYGSLMLYFKGPGVKNTSDYQWLDDVIIEPVKVTGVSLDKTALTLTEGETATLTATVTPADADDKSLVWSTSNAAVATVSENGIVTAVAAGTAIITVTTTDGGFSATCEVTVNKPAPTEPTPAPVFSIEGGEVESGTELVITATLASDELHYSIDGGQWKQTTGEVTITIDHDMIISAYTLREGYLESESVQFTFIIRQVVMDALETIESDAKQSRKVMHGSEVYIVLPNGTTFTPAGSMVK